MLNLAMPATGKSPPVGGEFRRLFFVSVGGLASAAATVVFLATLAGFGGRVWWVFDLFSHFRVQYLLSSAAMALVLVVCRRFRSLTMAALGLVLNLACVAPYYWPVRDETGANSTALRAASVNVNTANRRYDLVTRFVLSTHPDVLLLTEVNAAWINAMDTITPVYPYRKYESREDNFGIALYSKLPFRKAEIAYFGESMLPSIVAEIDVDGRMLTIVGTHAPPPVGGEFTRYRDRQLEDLGTFLAAAHGPKILLGDLNASPWAYSFRRLLERAALRDSSIGRGINPTWPTNSILFRIPIDFCLVSDEIAITGSRTGPDIASDHDPLTVEFSVPLAVLIPD
jgi:endonuclease/exonuclease/phosphatase (EEP) superfamily protein YafD